MPSNGRNKDEDNDDKVRAVVMSFLKVPLFPRLHRKEEIYIVACALALFLRLLYCISEM